MSDLVERVARAIHAAHMIEKGPLAAWTWEEAAKPYYEGFARAAIAAMQADAEPVAWMYVHVNDDGECEQIEYGPDQPLEGFTPLYAHPVDLPAAREAAARAALEAAAYLTWKQADDLNNGPPAEYEDHRQFDAGRAHEASCITAAIRAIDPAQFREAK